MGFARDNGIKALCFDIDGTFYPKRQTHEYLLLSFFSTPVFSLKYNSMRQKMRQQDGLASAPELTLDEFRRKECLLMYGRKRDDYLYHYKCLYDSWQRTSRLIRPFPHVREALEKAKGEGYILGALSDFPLGSKLRTLGLEGLFDYEASTEDCGYLKPNATPFVVMCREIGVKPEEVLYTGDSERKDVKGAANAGLCTALIDVGGSHKETTADLHLTGWDKFITMVL